MELRQLRYFVAVAQHLSFTKAARALRVAQPALSRQIRQLEDEIKVRLLERNRRQTQLTPGGRVFLAEACALLEQAQRAVHAAQQSDRLADSQLTVGYVWGLFHALAPSAISRLRQLLPEVRVHLLDMTAAEQAEGLAEGQLDAGFIGFAHEAAARGLAMRQVGACDFMAVLPERHPLRRRSRVSLKALASERFVMISDRSYPGTSRIIHAACNQAGFEPRILQQAERGYTILGIVAGHGGVAILPEPLRALPHSGVIFRPLDEPVSGELFIAWHAARRRPARDTLLTLFAEAATSRTDG